jgi:hypothetical protein
MNAILDARSLRKGKWDFLVSWHNSTVANDIWIAEENLPETKKAYLIKFRELHAELFQSKKKKNGKKASIP